MIIFGESLSKLILMTDATGWTYYFWGFTFGQNAIGFIKRHK
jgi:hypothetical protein